MKEAIDWAAKNGGATGENVAKGFYQKKDWVPAGMEGVCNPSTWTDKDHRGTLKVDLYRSKPPMWVRPSDSASWRYEPSHHVFAVGPVATTWRNHRTNRQAEMTHQL